MNPVELKSYPFDGDKVDPCVLDIDIDTTGYDLIGFRIESDESYSVDLLNASYLTDVPEDSINQINLALSTTTFKNEQYILPNIELIKAGISKEDGPIRDHFHMFVVDNGQTLDSASLSDGLVTVLESQYGRFGGIRAWNDGGY